MGPRSSRLAYTVTSTPGIRSSCMGVALPTAYTRWRACRISSKSWSRNVLLMTLWKPSYNKQATICKSVMRSQMHNPRHSCDVSNVLSFQRLIYMHHYHIGIIQQWRKIRVCCFRGTGLQSRKSWRVSSGLKSRAPTDMLPADSPIPEFIELNSSFSNDANAYYFMSNTTLARGVAF